MDTFIKMGLGNCVVLDDATNVYIFDHIVDGLWKLYFNGSFSRSGLGIGMVIEGPDLKIHLHSYMLQFECANNEVEYEDLIHGLELEKNMGIKCLRVLGDFELKVNHMKDKYGIGKCRLKVYT